MSIHKELKIKRMRKNHVWPTVVMTIFSFLFSSVSVVLIVAYLWVFTFDGKMQSSQGNADNSNLAIEEHMENALQKAAVYEKQLENGITSLNNLDELQAKLNYITETGGYADSGIWLMDTDTPYTANGIELPLDSSFYQSFLKGEEGIYTVDTEQGKFLIYTTIWKYDENQKAVFFLVEDAHLNIEGIKSTSLEKSAGTYVLDSNNQTVAWVGSEEDKIPYEDLLRKKIDGLIGFIFKSDETVYLDSCKGIIATSTENETELIFNPLFIITSSDDLGNEENTKNPIEGSLWIEKEMNINGWKTVSNQHMILNPEELNKLLKIAIMSLIILFIPLFAMLSMIILQLQNRKKLTNLLYFDTVTGGKNWLYFKALSARIMKKRKYRYDTYAMVAFEVNHFRIFCDYNGSNAGDELLEKMNQQLSAMVDKREAYGRYAGAHFGMLIKYQSEEQLKERLQNIFDKFSKNYTKDRISFSAGVYMITDKKVLIDTLYNYAGGAKNTDNGQLETQISMFNSKIRDQQLWEKEVENTMEKALVNKEFAVYLQPKYNTSTEVLSGAEALVRWISKDKGFVSPGVFIPIFEKNGFITKLDDYMLNSVAQLQAEWIKAGRKVIPISVNVSRVHFANPDLAEHIRDIVDAYGTPHNVIELELTESAFFDDKNILLNTVCKLKEYGFVVSMDDFGAGYSSLNSLKDLPLDVVKLDGEFFRDTEDKERGESVVRDTIHLAKNLNMKIVAEGIETKDQVDFLEKCGCDLIQGFYFAKPMPVDEFEKSAFE